MFEARLSSSCAQGNRGTLKHWDTMRGYKDHRMPTQANSVGCCCAHAKGDTDLRLTAVPHSFLSNCPETDPPRHVHHWEWDNAWGTSQLQQPQHRRSTFFCMVGRSTSPWCRRGGLDSVSPPSRAVPPSVPDRLHVWHLQKQCLETLLAALLL